MRRPERTSDVSLFGADISRLIPGKLARPALKASSFLSFVRPCCDHARNYGGRNKLMTRFCKFRVDTLPAAWHRVQATYVSQKISWLQLPSRRAGSPHRGDLKTVTN